MGSESLQWNKDWSGKLICPVCCKDQWTYLRCYRPDCTDGRYLIKESNNEKEGHSQN